MEKNFNDYLQILKTRKRDIIIFFLTIVFVVTGASLMIQPSYRATVTLVVDLESPNVLATGGAVSLGETNYYAYKEYLQSQKEIITSRSIARQVFQKLRLDQIDPAKTTKKGLKGQIKSMLSWLEDSHPRIFTQLQIDKLANKLKRPKDPIDEFLKNVKVELVRDTRLLLLHVDNRNPYLAAQIANAIADLYVARNLTYITKSEVLNLLKNEYLRLQAQISEYSKVYKHKHPKIVRLNQEIEQIKAKIKSTDSASFKNLKANNIAIQDRAEAPLAPRKPNIRLNILMAMFVGLFGGVGLAFLFEYLDDTVEEFYDVEKHVPWPFLGAIPQINGVVTKRQKDIFTQIRPRDHVSEAYRAVRTSVLFSSTPEHPLKSILITSPGPQEGKTSVLCNLGITLAQAGKRVLLVDADMRKPRLHKVFKLKNELGLSNYLSGRINFESVLQDAKIGNLFLISAGVNPTNPSELLIGQNLEILIDAAKARFDFILFDAPPIFVVTDAVIIAQKTDGTIIVLESGKTNLRLLSRTNQILQDAKAQIIGTLLNKISLKRSNYYHYSNYYGKKL